MPLNLFPFVSVPALGLLFGFKHALDADHLAAVWTIVSHKKGVLRTSLVGALWGVGHTMALLVGGVLVIVLHVQISERTARLLELCVALMLIGLGMNALRALLRGGQIHLHAHRHGGRVHVHAHVHGGAPDAGPGTHHGVRLAARPLLVGMVHGLAGSAALTLLVISTLSSKLLAFAYIAAFGMGSIGGMMCMSMVVSLPAQLTAARCGRASTAVRVLAGVFSLGLGLYMVYQISTASGPFA